MSISLLIGKVNLKNYYDVALRALTSASKNPRPSLEMKRSGLAQSFYWLPHGHPFGLIFRHGFCTQPTGNTLVVTFEGLILKVKAKPKSCPNPQTKTHAKKLNPKAIDT